MLFDRAALSSVEVWMLGVYSLYKESTSCRETRTTFTVWLCMRPNCLSLITAQCPSLLGWQEWGSWMLPFYFKGRMTLCISQKFILELFKWNQCSGGFIGKMEAVWWSGIYISQQHGRLTVYIWLCFSKCCNVIAAGCPTEVVSSVFSSFSPQIKADSYIFRW